MPTFAVDRVNNEPRRQVVDECLMTLVERGLTEVHRMERALPAPPTASQSALDQPRA